MTHSLSSARPAALSRPRNADASRRAILEAAQKLFSTAGYASTGIRDVASMAGVNSALVGRYFGSKLKLFEAALEDMLDMERLLRTSRADFGRHTVDVLFRRNRATPLAIMLLSTADPQARQLALELVQARIIAPLAEWLGGPDGEEKATRVNILWVGFITCWQLLPLEGLSAERIVPLRAWLERETQAIVDEASATPVEAKQNRR